MAKKKAVKRKSKFPIVIPMKRMLMASWSWRSIRLCGAVFSEFYGVPNEITSIRIKVSDKPTSHSYKFLIKEDSLESKYWNLRYKGKEIVMFSGFRTLLERFGLKLGQTIHVEVEYDA